MNNVLSLKGSLVWLICVLFYLYELFLRTILGSFQSELMTDLQLSTTNFALLSSSAYLVVYGMMQMPVGECINRFGLKKAMIFAIVICIIATFGFSVSHSQLSAFFFRSLMGLGSAFGFIGMIVAVYDWMPYKNIALFIGLSQFIGTLGPMAAAGPLSTLINFYHVTWRYSFFVLSLTGAVIAFLIVFFVKQRNSTDTSMVILKIRSNLKNELFSILKNKQVWYIAFSYALIYFSLEYFSENEGKQLLMTKGFSSSFSSYMITLSWFGFAIGSPIMGYLSDRINRRKPLLVLSAMITALSLYAIIFVSLSITYTYFVCFIYGFSIGASSVGVAIMGEQFKSDLISTGLSIKNTVTILFISTIAPIISFLLSQTSNHSSYSIYDYQKVFIIIIGFAVLAFGIYLLKVKETYCRSNKELVILNYKN